MDLSGSDEEAWEAHVQEQIQNHKERVRELREQGLRRVGLGSTILQEGTQPAIDLTEEILEDSQETEEGVPGHIQEAQQGNP
eukprot:1881120-Heterocapsa_arctica.AAC.1